MSQDVEADDSDTSSLPDLSEIITAPPTSISKGDIVWAKFKNLYWPALVRSVYTKDKKISIWYTDEPGKTFKLPLKNVHSFHDEEMRIKIEKDVREAGCAQEHEGLTSHASMYLKRRAQGRVDNPMKFFDQTYPFYLMEELLQKNPDADVDSIKIPPLYISHEMKSIRKTVNFRNVSTSAVESESESVNSSEESNAESNPKDYLLKVKQEYTYASSKNENVDKIVEFIKSGKADSYLKKILSRQIPSEHRDIYDKELKCRKNFTIPITYSGPVDNDEKLRDLIFYLLSLYDNMVSVRKGKRYLSRQHKSKFLEYPSFDKKSERAQYVASVLLPEAIIYAMSDIYNISIRVAKQLFQERSESETKVEKIIASLSSNDTTHNSKSAKSKLLGKNIQCEELGSNNVICSPLKKKCVVMLQRNPILEKWTGDSMSITLLNSAEDC